jgi:hypothetical protein
MTARRKQLPLSFEKEIVRWLPTKTEKEVVVALAELLLAAATEETTKEQDDERKDPL